MPDDQTPADIEAATEARWSGALKAIVKYLPHLLAAVATSLALFNGFHASQKENQIDAHLRHTDSQVVNILTNSIE